jgi:hypothetical protein
VLEVFSATARLLDGATLSGLPFTLEEAIDLLIAALLHDSGYIQEKGDTQGTGAKYTKTHVDRSASFALAQAATFGLSSDGAGRVSRWILGTDLARPWAELNLPGKREGDAAAILAAADILGQMGDRAYLEKLLFLYYEFKEAGITGYGSAYDILEKTLGFYEGVKKRLDVTLASTKDYASRHFSARYGTDRDLYREAIQRQMDYLAGIVADDGSNFRKKLKRMDLEAFSTALSSSSTVKGFPRKHPTPNCDEKLANASVPMGMRPDMATMAMPGMRRKLSMISVMPPVPGITRSTMARSGRSAEAR